jgi:IS30 family transposase
MARRAEARTAVVAGADLRLAEAATPCRPRHADIARNDLSKSLYSDPRCAEEAADGASADGAADASSRGAAPQRADWDRSSILSPSANGPAEARDRAVPGHWEGDLLTGANNSHIATLVERHTRFVMLLKIPSRDTATVVGALTKHVRKLPQQLRRSLTWDRGKEMADHKSFTVATNVQVYFCDPHSPWQRGSNRRPPFLIRICQ